MLRLIDLYHSTLDSRVIKKKKEHGGNSVNWLGEISQPRPGMGLETWVIK